MSALAKNPGERAMVNYGAASRNVLCTPVGGCYCGRSMEPSIGFVEDSPNANFVGFEFRCLPFSDVSLGPSLLPSDSFGRPDGFRAGHRGTLLFPSPEIGLDT
jgi:hypothetical protein